MSDSLVRKIVVVNPTTDERETRYLATSAKNVDNLDSFIGLGVDGNVGPITKLTGQDAFNALFTDTETQSWVLPYGFKGVAYKIGNSLVGAYIEQIDFSLRLNSTSVYKIFYAKGLADEKFTLSCNGVSGDYATVPFKAYIGSVEQAGTFNLTEEHNSDGQLVFNGSFSSLPSTATFAADFINSEGFWLVSKYGKTLLETEDKEKIDSLEELDGTKIPLDRTTSLDYTIKDKFNSIDNILKSKTSTISSSTTDATPINASTIYWEFDSNQNFVYRVKSLYGRPICVELLSATLKVGNYSEACNAKYGYGTRTFYIDFPNLLKAGWKDNVIDYKFEDTNTVWLIAGDNSSSGTLIQWTPTKDWSDNSLLFTGDLSGNPYSWCTIRGGYNENNTPLITFYF